MKRLFHQILEIASLGDSQDFYYLAEQEQMLRECETNKLKFWMSYR